MYNLTNIQLPSSMEAQDKYFVIAGFALNGPVNVPFMIRDNVSIYDVLGYCPMADSYTVARSRGLKPLLLRLNGNHGTQDIFFPTGEVAATLTSVEAHDRCNEINITVYPTHIRITGVLGDERFYVFSQYPTLGSLMDAVNADAKYGVGEVKMKTNVPLSKCSTLTEFAYDTWLTEADDGENYVSRFDGTDAESKLDLQISLIRESMLDEGQDKDGMDVYSHTGELSPFNIDTIIVPDIMYEESPIIAEIMGKYCYSKTTEQDLFCSCVIGSMCFQEEESDEYPYSTMMEQLTSIGAASNESYYSHVEIVIGVEENLERGMKMPLATKFAVSRAFLPVEVSATNKEIADISILFSRLRKEDIASLAASGYTCIIPSIRRGYVAYKSMNFVADKNLITSKPHFNRATRYHANQIVTSLDSYIGQPATTLQLNAMEQFLRVKITEVEELGIYKAIEYVIQGSGTNEVKIELTFVIYGEVESVYTSASYDPVRKTVIAWMT